MRENAKTPSSRLAGKERLLTIEEAAERLNCSTKHVRRKIDAGEIRALRDGRFIRIPPEELRRYEEAHLPPVLRKKSMKSVC